MQFIFDISVAQSELSECKIVLASSKTVLKYSESQRAHQCPLVNLAECVKVRLHLNNLRKQKLFWER
jgi:hypothetical protein